jgi:hypothetical protein
MLREAISGLVIHICHMHLYAVYVFSFLLIYDLFVDLSIEISIHKYSPYMVGGNPRYAAAVVETEESSPPPKK